MSKRTLGLVLILSASVPAVAQQPQLPPYKAGFPQSLPGQGAVVSHPVLADLAIPGGTPGAKSIIFGGINGNLHVIYRTSGGAWQQAPGFPVQLGGRIESSPAVGDLNGDGVAEIVVGHGDFNNTQPGGVKAFRNNGVLLWSRPSMDVGAPNGQNGQPDSVVGTPAIGDVDADGQNDVVWGATDFRLYLVNGANGANKPNWPRHMLDTVLSSPSLHDMNGDGRPEIIVGVDAHADPAFGTPNGGCLHVLPAAQPPLGTDVGYPQNFPGFPKCVDQVIFSSPAVGDIDGDGRPEIVHGTGVYPPYPGTKAVYAWKCDGTPVPGWPVPLSGELEYGTSVALANLDGDAALEAVVAVAPTSHVYAINGNGSVMPGFPKAPKHFFGAVANVESPIVADVLGDTALEILVPTNTEVAVFDLAGNQLTEDGAPYTGAPSFYLQTALANVAVGDLDPGDNRIEVVAVGAGPFPTAANTEIHVWNPVTRTSTPPWGSFRQNERRAGTAPGTPPCRTYGACPAPPPSPRLRTVPPCRILDTRNPPGPYGGPALAHGGLRDFTIRNQCLIPPSAKTVSINVTVVSPTNSGFLSFSPSCQIPNASTINFGPGQIRANNAVLGIGNADGILTAYAFVNGGGSVHLLIDVNGYFE